MLQSRALSSEQKASDEAQIVLLLFTRHFFQQLLRRVRRI